ncbi:MAG: ABC transporter permease [Pseudomonadota bacterium]
MADTTATIGTTTSRQGGLRNTLSALFLSSESIRGYSLLSPTLLVMAIGILIPFAILLTMSFWTQVAFDFDTTLSLNNYRKGFEHPVYETLMLRSIMISGSCAIITVLLSYPMAYYVAFHVKKHKMLWIILMTLPFWTSYLLRVFAWKVVLGYNGVINSGLKSAGIIEQPMEFLLYSPLAVVITLAHAWAAFAILPLYVSLEKIDRSLLEAATDLGDGPVARFLRITLPLSLPGIIAATLIIFIPTVGDYITPALLGGPDGIMIANMIQAMFGKVNNWPMGAALSVAMMITVALFSLTFMFVSRKATERIG